MVVKDCKVNVYTVYIETATSGRKWIYKKKRLDIYVYVCTTLTRNGRQ